VTAATIPVRVKVLDSWDEVALDLSPGTTITELKRAALAHCRIRRHEGEYMVKHLGAELFENGHTLADAGVGPNSALIVLLRRRRPSR
jgi:hypothetical protein